MKRTADAALPRPHVSDPIRSGDPAYARKAAETINSAIGTETLTSAAGSRHLPICRNTPAYVVAADLIDLRSIDPVKDGLFRAWIKGLRDNS